MLTRAPGRTVPDAAELFAPLLGFDHIGVAVSGGPDSLALMVLIADWAMASGKTITVYTVDHRLRPEAVEEAKMVADQAARLGLSCRILTWTGDKPKTGVQAAARQARYRLIGDAMRVDGAEILVTAHHRDDQAETVLMRLAHGSGISGLAGMALFGKAEGVPVCRPLRDTDPADLNAVLDAAGLTPASDPSNDDLHYERVRWRRLLPVLAREGLDATELGRFASRMARADAALEAASAAAVAELVDADPFGLLQIDAARLLTMPDEIAIRVLRRMIDWAGGGLPHGRLGQIETLHTELAKSVTNVSTTLCGAVITGSRQRIAIYREAGRLQAEKDRLVPGARIVWDKRFEIASSPSSDVLTIAPGTALTRDRAETFCGAPVAAPMAALAAAPVIRDETGTLIAIGAIVRRDGIEIKTTHVPAAEQT